MEFKHLWTPIKIGSMTVRNRFALPSMGLMYTMDGVMNDRLKNFYYERARGGVGLVIVGPCAVDKAGGGPVLIGLDEDRFLPELTRFNQEIHRIEPEVKVAAQLFQAGRYALSFMISEQPVSASDVPSKMTGETPRPLSVEEIKELVKAYGRAAHRAQESGFDAVEVLACTGYLICQFLSPLTNLRTDEYGGCLENRMRFGLEVIREVRRVVGPDYPILTRVAGHDYMPGSHTNKESRLFCQAAVEAGVNAINVTGGWHETRVPQLPSAVPSGAFVYLARGIKEAVNVPVLASNRLGDPVLAEKTLREGSADMICLGRPLIADPYLPNKVKAGKLDEITYCISCNQMCFDNVFVGQPVGCMINPRASHEGEIEVTPAANPRSVLVVGGGAAGLMAALTAARRGHQVTLWEQEKELGGQANLAAATPGKNEFHRLIPALTAQAKNAGVKIKTGKKATLAAIKKANPAIVMVATGAEPIVPRIPGVNGPQVKLAWDVITGKAEVTGKQVVVIGGSATGCETALLIAQQGTLSPEACYFLFAHEAEDPKTLREAVFRGIPQVTIVEMLPRIAENAGRTTRWVLIKELHDYHIGLKSNTKVLEITPTGVKVDQNGEIKNIPADEVILAVGAKSERRLYEQLKAAGVEAHAIGDAVEPRKLIEALAEGFHIALKI